MKFRSIIALLFLFLSSIAHAQWVRTMGPGDAISLAATSDALFAGVKGGLFVTYDDGITWQKNGFDTDWVQALIVQNDTIFAGTNLHGIFRSGDDGKHWSAVSNGIADSLGIYCFTICGSNLLTGTDSGIFISTDNGDSWRRTNVHQLTHPITAEGPNACAVVGQTSFYFSTDKGENWVRTGPMPSFSYDLKMMGDFIFSPGPKIGVLRSQFRGDSGSWTIKNNGLNVNSLFTGHSFAQNANDLFLGASVGIFMTADSGEHWSDMTDGATDPVGHILFGNVLYVWNDRLWVAGADSVWYRPLSELIIPNSVPAQSSASVQCCIFPNPVKNSASISLSFLSQVHASVSIVNSEGTTVANVFEGNLNREESLRWDSRSIPNGTYFCLVRAENRSSVIPFAITH